MNKVILIAAIAVSLLNGYISYKIGNKHGQTECVNTADVLHSDTNNILSIYISDNLGIA